MHPRLSQLFNAAVGKDLSAVETDPSISNQHEFHGVAALQQLLGEPDGRERLPTRFVAIDDDLDTVEWDGEVTWYDARQRARLERGIDRHEYRLYYPANPVMSSASSGDGFILARRTDGSLLAIVTPSGSTVGFQLRTLFALQDQGELFSVGAADDAGDLDLTDTAILEALGLAIDWTDDRLLDGLVHAFGGTFPTTAAFSTYARDHAADINPLHDPDAALVEWMGTEEVLFRTLEKHLITRALTDADGDVNRVLDVAKRSFQRRRARAGQALENHLQHLLEVHQIPHTRGGRTEGNKRPDFLVPGIDHYHDASWPADRLLMLGAKTSCRDRWRQVLTEADRVPDKHLITLEAPISSAQLSEMETEHLHLVVPRSLQARFDESDQGRLLTVSAALTMAHKVVESL